MRRLTLSIAAAMLLASAGAALGVDKINGKPLADIHDIVREVNGEEALIPKASLMKLVQDGSSLRGSLITVPISQRRKLDIKERKDVAKVSGINDQDHYMGIAAAATTRRIFGEGAERRVVVGDLKFGGSGSGSIKTFRTAPTKDGAITLSGDVRSLPIKIPGAGSRSAFTDMRGGLFIDGERIESFVAGFMDDKDRKDTFSGGNNGGKKASVGFLILDGRKLNDESFKGDPTAIASADVEPTDAQFPALRIVAGDFDGDGKRSEIAYIATPKEKPYYLHIYKVSRDPKDSSLIKLTDLYSEDIGDIDLGVFHGKQRDTEPGCDIVAGDFDGDGITELAAIVVAGKGSKLKPLVKTYKYVDGKFKSSEEVFDNDSPDLCDSAVPGLLAAAGDFDGSGADDISFAVVAKSGTKDDKNRHMLELARFSFDAVSGGAPKPVLKYHIDYNTTTSKKYTPLASIASLAAGPMYAAEGNGGICDDLYLMYKSTAGSTVIDHRVEVDPLIGTSATEHVSTESGTKPAAIMISDLAGESMALGECDHIMVEDVRSYFTLLPAVPYHIDYIRSDWRSPKATPAPRSLQIVTPATSKVTYSTTDKGSRTKDWDFAVNYGLEGYVEGGIGGGTPETDDKGEPIEKLGEKKEGGFLKKVGLKGEADLGVKFFIKAQNKKMGSETTSWSTTLSATAQKDDIAHYFTGTLHTWRYPIIGTLADDAWVLDQLFADERHGGDVPKDDPLKNADIDRKQPMFYTVTRLADGRDAHNGEQAGDRYQPPHDERNIFSYPNDLQFINDYMTRQIDLSQSSSVSSNFESSKKIGFDQLDSSGNGWHLDGGGAVYANATGSVAVPPGKRSIFSGHLKGSVEVNVNVGGGITYNDTTNSSESYSVDVYGSDNDPESVYEIEYAAYVNSGGITTLGFAANMRPGPYPRQAWDPKGPYGLAPDPSLVLPSRVYIDKNGAATADTRPYVATVLRGVRIYDRTAKEDPDVGTSYTVSTLVRGRKYTIVVPVYNASFMKTGKFEVQLGYTTQDHIYELIDGVPAPDDPDVKSITSKDMSLEGWVHGSDAHRGAVSFDWTVPFGMEKDHYAMCVRIVGRDGDIHRDWDLDEESSEYDPCGNDWGHFLFSVIDEKDIWEEPQKNITFVSPIDGSIISVAAARGEGKGELRAAAAPSEPEVKLTFKVDGQPPMTFDEFRRWLVGRTAMVDVEIEAAYTGDHVVTGAYVMVYEELEGGSIRTLVDRDFSALFPGKSASRHVKVDPQKFLSRDLRVKISGSSVSQTFGEPTEGGSSSSGSGCAAGAAGIAAIALLAAAARRKK